MLALTTLYTATLATAPATASTSPGILIVALVGVMMITRIIWPLIKLALIAGVIALIGSAALSGGAALPVTATTTTTVLSSTTSQGTTPTAAPNR